MTNKNNSAKNNTKKNRSIKKGGVRGEGGGLFSNKGTAPAKVNWSQRYFDIQTTTGDKPDNTLYSITTTRQGDSVKCPTPVYCTNKIEPFKKIVKSLDLVTKLIDNDLRLSPAEWLSIYNKGEEYVKNTIRMGVNEKRGEFVYTKSANPDIHRHVIPYLYILDILKEMDVIGKYAVIEQQPINSSFNGLDYKGEIENGTGIVFSIEEGKESLFKIVIKDIMGKVVTRVDRANTNLTNKIIESFNEFKGEDQRDEDLPGAYIKFLETYQIKYQASSKAEITSEVVLKNDEEAKKRALDKLPPNFNDPLPAPPQLGPLPELHSTETYIIRKSQGTKPFKTKNDYYKRGTFSKINGEEKDRYNFSGDEDNKIYQLIEEETGINEKGLDDELENGEDDEHNNAKQFFKSISSDPLTLKFNNQGRIVVELNDKTIGFIYGLNLNSKQLHPLDRKGEFIHKKANVAANAIEPANVTGSPDSATRAHVAAAAVDPAKKAKLAITKNDLARGIKDLNETSDRHNKTEEDPDGPAAITKDDLARGIKDLNETSDRHNKTEEDPDGETEEDPDGETEENPVAQPPLLDPNHKMLKDAADLEKFRQGIRGEGDSDDDEDSARRRGWGGRKNKSKTLKRRKQQKNKSRRRFAYGGRKAYEQRRKKRQQQKQN